VCSCEHDNEPSGSINTGNSFSNRATVSLSDPDPLSYSLNTISFVFRNNCHVERNS
jgi:hypothetical protein